MATATIDKRRTAGAADTSLGITERVLIAIQSYGLMEPHFSLDELAAKTGLSRSQIYSAMYRMSNKLEVLTEQIPGTGNRKIFGARLKEAPPVVKRPAVIPLARATTVFRLDVPETRAYIARVSAVEEARKILREAGIDTEDVIRFEANPLGSEAAQMLTMIMDTRRENNRLTRLLEEVQRELDSLRPAQEQNDHTSDDEPAHAEEPQEV